MKQALTSLATKARHLHDRIGARLLVLLTAGLAATPAWAQQADDFGAFRDAVEAFAGGNFAIAISIVALILGAVMGLAKLSAWPALVGFAIAAVFAIGPYLIVQIFGWFTL